MRLLLKSVLTISIAALPASAQPRIAPDAFRLIEDRALETKRTFWIYKNGGDQHHGVISKATTGGHSGSELMIPALRNLDVNSHCVPDLSQPDGCAPDAAPLDCERGTALRLRFPLLLAGSYIGIDIEEPERFRERSGIRGYDLRGATRLVFDIASASEDWVQFDTGIGRLSRIEIHKSEGWKTVSLPLQELMLDDAALQNAPLLFSVRAGMWSTAGKPAILLFDNIRLEPAPARQAGAISLPGSTQTCGSVPKSVAPIPVDQQLSGVSTVYESSIAAIALARARPSNYKSSLAAIAEALTFAVNNDNAALPVPPAADGSGAKGIRSGYEKGELPLHNSQLPPLLGQQGQVQLAGFSVPTDEFCGTGRFCLVNDEVTGGSSAFAIMALVAASRELNAPAHLDAARSIGRWVAANLRDNAGYGGFFNGYRNPGLNDSDKTRKILNRGKSVENMAVLAAAYYALADAEIELGRNTEATRWTELATHAANAVMGFFLEPEGRFAAGTTPDSTRSPGIEPDCGTARKGADCLNRADFLDANTSATLALVIRPEYRSRIDWRRPMRWVLNNQRKQVRAKGQDFAGFSLVKQAVSGPDGIAWEFTSQVSLSLRLLHSMYSNEGFDQQANQILDAIATAKMQAPFADGRGLPAATLPDGNDKLGLHTPFQEIPQRVNLAATVFAIFAESNINPFHLMPRFKADLVVSGASFAPSPDNGLSAGSYFSIFGANLSGSQMALTQLVDGRLPFVLGGTSVLVDGRCAPLSFVSPGQINAQAPAGLTANTATVEVRTFASGNDCLSGLPGTQVVVPHKALAPAFFTASGDQVIVLHQDGTTLVTASAPARPGEIVTFYGTGWGLTQPSVREGDLAAGLTPVSAALSLTVGTASIVPADILYAGLAPGFAGLYQLNARLPQTMPPGTAPVRLCIASACSTQDLTLPIGPPAQ